MIIVGAVVAVAAVVTTVASEYGRKPGTAAGKKEVAFVTAMELLAAFATDEAVANARYVGTQEQAIRVTGIIRSIGAGGSDQVNVVLEAGDPMAGVVCEFNKADVPADWTVGDTVALKGICTGYLIDVILNRCNAVE